ncbi:MAG: 2-amino-4-hydroxy-6-hydroxymethyldihydropteridine diphosphokinase [Erythrobacter sp.]
MSHQYLIALGSNRPTGRDGPPRNVLEGAIEALEDVGLLFHQLSEIIETAPIGPSQRRYANAAAVVETRRDPESMLGLLKGVEGAFGHRRGQRWGARALDLDIVLWDGGVWNSRELTIPHVSFRERAFVLGPAAQIAADWRDPITGLSVQHLHARLTRPKPATR